MGAKTAGIGPVRAESRRIVQNRAQSCRMVQNLARSVFANSRLRQYLPFSIAQTRAFFAPA